MAAKGLTLLTLADVAKTKDKEIGKVAEVLVQHNAMLEDIPYMEMNEGTHHIESIRSALPAIYYRKANQAIAPSKSTIEERTFNGTSFESKSQMDTKVASRGGLQNIGFNRWNQAEGHLQAHALEHAGLTLYGSPVTGTMKTAGLFDIFSTLDPTEPTSKQIVDAGGTTSDNTSIVRVQWGPNALFGVYPKGTKSGLTRIDRSAGNKEVQIQGLDAAGNPGTFYGFEENFETNHGLVVKDYRQAVRIANIDVANLISGAGAADLIDLMISGHYKTDSLTNGKGAWYVNRTIYAHLHKQSRTAVGSGAGLTYENYQGKPVLMFLGAPVRLMDAILNTEDRVVA